MDLDPHSGAFVFFAIIAVVGLLLAMPHNPEA